MTGGIEHPKEPPNRLVIPAKDMDVSKLVFEEGKAQAPYWKKMGDDSWISPFGHVYHAFIVELQPDGTYLHRGDTMIHEDGKCEPYGSANPGVVVVPYRVEHYTGHEGDVYVRGFLQWREALRNPAHPEVMGSWTFGIPGGYDLAGKGPKAEALRHALEEGGVILHDPVEIGAGTSNRMFIPTCIRIFAAEYELNPAGRIEGAQGFEHILGTHEFRADEFPRDVCLDLIVAAAFAYFYSWMGLIDPNVCTCSQCRKVD